MLAALAVLAALAHRLCRQKQEGGGGIPEGGAEVGKSTDDLPGLQTSRRPQIYGIPAPAARLHIQQNIGSVLVSAGSAELIARPGRRRQHEIWRKHNWLRRLPVKGSRGCGRENSRSHGHSNTSCSVAVSSRASARQPASPPLLHRLLFWHRNNTPS